MVKEKISPSKNLESYLLSPNSKTPIIHSKSDENSSQSIPLENQNKNISEKKSSSQTSSRSEVPGAISNDPYPEGAETAESQGGVKKRIQFKDLKDESPMIKEEFKEFKEENMNSKSNNNFNIKQSSDEFFS